MASMAAAADLSVDPLKGRAPADVAVLSYAPGIVDTPMQQYARSQSADVFPSAPMFQQWHAEGALVPPEAPAAEMAEFLASGAQPGFGERRFGEG
jgi:NAD(P)-dependent dehydrogenase (short-subunit alcohol dehydrogenase family)